MKIKLIFTFLFLSTLLHADPELLYLDSAYLLKMENKYRVLVFGNTPTQKYEEIAIHPNEYVTPPINWEMSITGKRSSNLQALKPFVVRLDHSLSENTQKVSIKGKNKTITLNVKEALTAETINGTKVDSSGITFFVISSGCTKKTDFVCEVDKTRNFPTISLFRLRRDDCKAMPFIKAIEFKSSEFVSEKLLFRFYISNSMTYSKIR